MITPSTIVRPAMLVAAGVGLLVVGVAVRRQSTIEDVPAAIVKRSSLTATLTVSGTLRPAESITYRSPLSSRETQITFLVGEGTRVNEGDLVVRLDTSDLERELERVGQELRQARVDLQVADIDSQEGQAAVESIDDGEGALSVEEARTRLQAAEKKMDRLRTEYESMKPLLEKGFITREEVSKTVDALELAEEEVSLARRKAEILIERTRPRDRRRAALQLAQKEAQRENVRARMQEIEARAKALADQIEGCSLYAQRAGLVVYEEYLGASPRRKIRIGDRVNATQGLITIPEVSRMLVEASVNEAELHRVRPEQRATIVLEAFPGLRLTGKILRVGTLATSSPERSIEEKRFDLVVEVDATDADLRPEMTARVDVVIGERADVLVVPVNAVFERGGVPVVHVVGSWGIETRPVQAGESTTLEVEVVSGLREGERVALTDMVDSPVSAPSVSAPAAGTAPSKRAINGGRNSLDPR